MINIDNFSKFPIFNGIDKSAFEEILHSFSFRDLGAGEVLFKQGDDGDAMYMIEKGKVEIVLESDDTHQTIAMLGEGSFFGEIALITGEKRTATVKAIAATRLIAIDKKSFTQLIVAGQQGASDIAYNIAVILAKRLQATDEIILDILRKRVGKSEIHEYKKRLLEEWEF